MATKRTDGISTTDIIYRVLKNYECYVERSVKKGAKPEDINITNNKYFAVKMRLMWEKVDKRKSYNPLKFFFNKWEARGKFLREQKQ